MKRVEQVETGKPPIGDPLDALDALARACDARAIADDARRTSARLESSRLFVSIVGSPPVLSRLVERITGQPISPSLLDHRPLSVRFGRRASHLRIVFRGRPAQLVPVTWHDRLHAFGDEVVATEIVVESSFAQRGVVYGFGTLERPWGPSRRVDLLLVDRTDAAEARLGKWRGVRMLVVDTSRREELEEAFAVIDRMVIESGASRVEARLAQHTRHLCLRLEHHLYEHQRALIHDAPSLAARINALTIARVLAEAVLDTRARHPDPARQLHADWLAVERTKFLMATKADALIAFDERLAASHPPRHRLRRHVAALAGEIADDLLASLWERLRFAADATIAAYGKRLIADVETSLGDLGEVVPLAAMSGVDLLPVRGFRHGVRNASVMSRLADRVRLASRQRIERGMRSDVVTRLEEGSRALVEQTLEDYDEARATIERRFCELIDGALESARRAAELAEQARADGPDAVARARSRVSSWTAALTAIMMRVE